MSEKEPVKPWNIDWFHCAADANDVKFAKTMAGGNKKIKVGDTLWRCANGFGPIYPDHNHWAGSHLSGEESEILLAAAAPVLLDAIEQVLKETDGIGLTGYQVELLERAVKIAKEGTDQ